MHALTAFADAGFSRVEATSYSHPERVPGFADASSLLADIPRRPSLAYKATCPNQRAVQRALVDWDAGCAAEELSFLVSTTEEHSQRNLRASRAEQWDRVAEMVALAEGRFVLVGVISMALGCPFEGEVAPSQVVDDVRRFAELGVTMVTIGDTIGAGNPRSVGSLFADVLAEVPEVTPIAHLHDSRGTALANAVAALDAGCRYFDSAMGGVGGHPTRIAYGGGVTGNTATEDLVAMLERMGVRTGIDSSRLKAASGLCERILGRPLESKVARNDYGSSSKEAAGV